MCVWSRRIRAVPRSPWTPVGARRTCSSRAGPPVAPQRPLGPRGRRSSVCARAGVRFHTSTSTPAPHERVDDGPRAAAGAQDERGAPRTRRRREGRQEAGRVGVVGVDRRAVERQRVRGPDRPSRAGGGGRDRERGLLVRDRDVRSAQARRRRARGPSRRTPQAAPAAAGSASRRARARAARRSASPASGCARRASREPPGASPGRSVRARRGVLAPELFALAVVGRDVLLELARRSARTRARRSRTASRRSRARRSCARVGRGADRRQPRVADRCRRQARAPPRVERAVALELGDLQRPRPVVLVVAGRRRRSRAGSPAAAGWR